MSFQESRNLRPRAYTPTAYNNQLPTGFRPTPSLAELAGYQQRQQEQEEYVAQPRPTQQIYIEEPRPQIQRAPHRKVSGKYTNLIMSTLLLIVQNDQQQ